MFSYEQFEGFGRCVRGVLGPQIKLCMANIGVYQVETCRRHHCPLSGQWCRPFSSSLCRYKRFNMIQGGTQMRYFCYLNVLVFLSCRAEQLLKLIKMLRGVHWTAYKSFKYHNLISYCMIKKQQQQCFIICGGVGSAQFPRWCCCSQKRQKRTRHHLHLCHIHMWHL